MSADEDVPGLGEPQGPHTSTHVHVCVLLHFSSEAVASCGRQSLYTGLGRANCTVSPAVFLSLDELCWLLSVNVLSYPSLLPSGEHAASLAMLGRQRSGFDSLINKESLCNKISFCYL